MSIKERLLNILPIFILLCVAIVLIGSLFTNASTITETSSETTTETTEVDEFPFEIKSNNKFCEAEIKQELLNIVGGIQDELGFGKLMLNGGCDYEIEWIERAIKERDNYLIPDDGWYPGKLTADGTQQEIPEVKGTSHEKFKQLCQLYGLDASLIRSLETKYNLREGILLAILIAETSGGNNGNYVDEGCYNLGNVGNTDSGQRVCFEGKEVSIEQVAITLNNRMLGKTITLGCLSNAGSCQWRDDGGYRYATSNGNRERNVKAVMNMIYADDLGEDVDPARFVVKRVNFQ